MKSIRTTVLILCASVCALLPRLEAQKFEVQAAFAEIEAARSEEDADRACLALWRLEAALDRCVPAEVSELRSRYEELGTTVDPAFAARVAAIDSVVESAKSALPKLVKNKCWRLGQLMTTRLHWAAPGRWVAMESSWERRSSIVDTSKPVVPQLRGSKISFTTISQFHGTARWSKKGRPKDLLAETEASLVPCILAADRLGALISVYRKAGLVRCGDDLAMRVTRLDPYSTYADRNAEARMVKFDAKRWKSEEARSFNRYVGSRKRDCGSVKGWRFSSGKFTSPKTGRKGESVLAFAVENALGASFDVIGNRRRLKLVFGAKERSTSHELSIASADPLGGETNVNLILAGQKRARVSLLVPYVESQIIRVRYHQDGGFLHIWAGPRHARVPVEIENPGSFRFCLDEVKHRTKPWTNPLNGKKIKPSKAKSLVFKNLRVVRKAKSD